MTYTYTYRDEKGAVRTGTVDAANRAALFSELRGRGISPLSVKEGGDRPLTKKSIGLQQKAVLCALACLVLLVGVSLIFVTRDGTEPENGNTTKTKVVGVTATKAKTGAAQAEASNMVPRVTANIRDSSAKAAAANVVTSEVQAPELPSIGTNLPPQSAPLPPPTFDTASDQVIAMAIQADEHGMPPMPLSGGLEREFLESLNKEIVILDTDDEQTRSLKESVKATRAEIKKLMDEGMTFNQIMQEHQKLANENAKIRDDATLELKKILDSGDVEGAKAYKRKINLALDQMGIKGLSIAVTEEERAERAAARRERMLERRARQAAQAEAAAALEAAQDGR
ncbi:MAG: hypothetical protein ACI4UY_13155 [Kiritimatiellia bacterium]